jgi:hypothetical protein
MATKIERKPSVPAAATAGADELNVLHPEREVTIAGRRIVIREYGFVEGLKMRAIAQPFVDALYALVAPTSSAPSFSEVESLLADHSDCVLELMARAADVEREWIENLSDSDGYYLMQEWWIVAGNFFIRRVVQRLAIERAARLRVGHASTTPSSEPAMGAPQATSDSSPPGN